MRILILSVIFHLLFSVSSQAGKKVVITGDFINYKNSAPIIYYAGYSQTNLDCIDTITADSKGHFTIELSIDQPHVIFGVCEQDSGKFFLPLILVKPGEQHSIICTLTNHGYPKPLPTTVSNMSIQDPYCTLSVPNSQGQRFLPLLDVMSMKWNNKNQWDFAQPESLIDSLNIKIGRAILLARQVFEAKKIDNDYYELIKFCISYHIAYRLANAIDKMIRKEEYSQQRDQFELIREELFKNFPVTNDYILNTLCFKQYIQLYIHYLESKNKEEYDAFVAKGLQGTYELSLAKKVLSKEAYKYYALGSISHLAFLKKNKESLDFLEQFKSEYPEFVQSKLWNVFENRFNKRIQIQ